MVFKNMLNATSQILESIYKHPFNQELALGTLPKEKFIYYLIQDSLYLADFSRALAISAAKMPNHLHMKKYLEFALNAVQAEQDLHLGYIEEYRSRFDICIDLVFEPNFSCFTYTVNRHQYRATLSPPNGAILVAG